eukprot:sb/3466020/
MTTIIHPSSYLSLVLFTPLFMSSAEVWVSNQILRTIEERTPRALFHIAASTQLTEKIARVDASVNPTGTQIPLALSGAIRSCRCVRIEVLSKGADRSLSAVSIYGDVGNLPRSFLLDKTAVEFRKSIEELKKQIRKNKKKVSINDRRGQVTTPSCSTTGNIPPPNHYSNHSANHPPNIPEEFLDGITQSVMERPVILPSGNVIDQSSLERHEEEERKWGRPPSDPFTGLPFTDTRSPVHHTSLEYRITTWRRERGGSGIRLTSSSTSVLSRDLLENKARKVGDKEGKETVREKRLRAVQGGTQTAKRARTDKTDQCSTSNSSGVIEVVEVGDVDNNASSGSSLDKMFQAIANHNQRLELD